MPQINPNRFSTLKVLKAKSLIQTTDDTQQNNSQPLCNPHKFKQWLADKEAVAAINQWGSFLIRRKHLEPLLLEECI